MKIFTTVSHWTG